MGGKAAPPRRRRRTASPPKTRREEVAVPLQRRHLALRTYHFLFSQVVRSNIALRT